MNYKPEVTAKEKKYIEKRENVLKKRKELDVLVSEVKDLYSFHLGLCYLNKKYK